MKITAVDMFVKTQKDGDVIVAEKVDATGKKYTLVKDTALDNLHRKTDESSCGAYWKIGTVLQRQYNRRYLVSIAMGKRVLRYLSGV